MSGHEEQLERGKAWAVKQLQHLASEARIPLVATWGRQKGDFDSLAHSLRVEANGRVFVERFSDDDLEDCPADRTVQEKLSVRLASFVEGVRRDQSASQRLPVVPISELPSPRETLLVMISSTVNDLLPEREAIDQVIRHLGFRRFRSEDHPPVARSSVEVCTQMSRECDLYIGLLGGNYGSLVDDLDISFVELEFNEAAAADSGKVLVFVKDGVPRDARQTTFVERVTHPSDGYFVRRISAPEQLRDQVFLAIHDWLAARVRGGRVVSAGTPDEAEPAAQMESGFTGISLSQEAEDLLREASQSSDGVIIYARHVGGITISANRKAFVQGGSPREQAKWTAAIEDLEKSGFIKDAGHKGEVFQVTREGFQVADRLEVVLRAMRQRK